MMNFQLCESDWLYHQDKGKQTMNQRFIQRSEIIKMTHFRKDYSSCIVESDMEEYKLGCREN